jgi:hypothetical protein
MHCTHSTDDLQAPLRHSVLMWSSLCRRLAPLSAFTQYVACIAAQDTSQNQQAKPARLRFSTTDTSPPVGQARVQPGSISHTPATALCVFTLEVQVNEPANTTFLVLPGSPDPTNITSKDVISPGFEATLSLPSAARGNAAIAVGEQDTWEQAPVEELACGTTFNVRSSKHLHDFGPSGGLGLSHALPAAS